MYKNRKEQLKQEADNRKLIRNKRSDQEQLNLLNWRFGKDIGAVRERRRLLKRIAKQKQQ